MPEKGSFDISRIISQKESIQIIHLTIHSASNLPKTDLLFDKDDPYIIAYYGPLTYQSAVYHGFGENPDFNRDPSNAKSYDRQPLIFSFPYLAINEISLVIYDHDYCRSMDDFLGKCTIDLSSEVTMDESDIHEIELKGLDDESIKHNTPSVKYSISMKVGEWPMPSLKVYCHRKKVAGILKSIETGCFKWHKTFEINLQYVHEIFGDCTQHWNTQYDKAQQIFSKDSWSASVIRTAVTSTSNSLYQCSAIDTTMLKVHGGKEFLSMLKDGRNRSGKAKLFTYAIVESSLMFSETGKGFIADFVSKHAIHAGGNTHVIYSGEFHVSDLSGEPILVFDNNSGTYSPNPDDMPKLLTLLKANFPGVLFDCVDYQKDKLGEYKKRVGLE